MPYAPEKGNDRDYDPYLKGTTLRVYRFMLKQRKHVGISEIQKALGLSSSSVSEYHVRKLLRLGLIREEQGGYTIEKVVLENIIRIKRVFVPVQAAYVSFFGVALILLLSVFRPMEVDPTYFFAVMVSGVALAVSVFEMSKTLRRF